MAKKIKTYGPYKSVEEMCKEMKEREKKHPIKTFFRHHIYYPIYRLCENIRMFPKEVKWFIQRGHRGWADCDVWSVDWHLCRIIPPMLRRLRKTKIGGPFDDKHGGVKRWNEILDDMIFTFEAASLIQNYDAVFPDKNAPTERINAHRKKFKIKVFTKEEYDRYKKGWKLFQEYFYSLWD
jgi:hypothetical protein